MPPPTALQPSLSTDYDLKSLTALSVNREGTKIVVANRRAIHVVRLPQDGDDGTSETVRSLQHPSKHNIANLDWNPHPGFEAKLASPCNNNCLIWDLNANKPLTHRLQFHTGMVNDVRWSPFDPNQIATCAADTYLHIWDPRHPKKPELSYCAWTASATHVRWNRRNPMLVASAHDGEVRLWDTRKSGSPVAFVTAHMAKISDLDWSYDQEDIIATCSQDKEVKFWSTKTPRHPLSSISMLAPIASVRFTPFGSGVLVMPQRSSNVITMWDRHDLTQPMGSFAFDETAVKTIGVRTQIVENATTYGLLTCTKTGTVQQWQIPLEAQKAVGHDLEKSAPGMIFPGDQAGGDVEGPLAFELKQAALSAPAGVVITHANATDRTCLIVVDGERDAWAVRLQLTFPENYPSQPPTIRVVPGGSFPTKLHDQVIDLLSEMARTLCESGQPCVAGICSSARSHLTRLRDADSVPAAKTGEQVADQSRKQESSVSAGIVPVPRLSGVSWTVDNQLAFFHTYSAGTLMMFQTPPRTFSDLVTYVRESERIDAEQQFGNQPKNLLGSSKAQLPALPVGDESDSFLDLFGDRLDMDSEDTLAPGGALGPVIAPQTLLSNTLSQQSLNSTVLCLDLSSVLPLNAKLAAMYNTGYDHNFGAACVTNSRAAIAHHRPELARAWGILAQVCKLVDAGRAAQRVGGDYSPLSIYPLGKQLVESLVNHFIKLRDVQTLAMIVTLVRNIERSLAADAGLSESRHHELLYSTLSNLPSFKNRPKGASTGDMIDAAMSTVPVFAKRERGGQRTAQSSDALPWSSVPADSPATAPSPPTSTHNSPVIRHKSKSVVSSPDFNHAQENRLLPESLITVCDQFCIVYADILLRWGLLELRSEVLNAVVQRPFPPAAESDVSTVCLQCKTVLAGPRCGICRATSLQCSVCELSVRGLAHQCNVCGHGGHALHLQDWFSKHQSCPTGCGCICVHNLTSGVGSQPHTPIPIA